MTALALANTRVAAVASGDDMMSDTAQFELAQRWAKAFSESQLIPAHLRGKPADCLIAMMMAKQLGDNPLMVMQNIYIVSGKAGWSASYMIARANSSGVFKGRITWETSGEKMALAVKAKGVLADTLETVSATATMQMAVAEGWAKNAKYQTMGEHMLRWRAATMLIRLYCPEVMLGMHTADELETDNVPAPAAPQTIAASLDAFAGEVLPPPAEEDDVAEVSQPEPAAVSNPRTPLLKEWLGKVRLIEDAGMLAEAQVDGAADLEQAGAPADDLAEFHSECKSRALKLTGARGPRK